jgi:hypothetical protein
VARSSLRSITGKEDYGNESLEHIEEQCKKAPFDADLPGYIGSPDVSAASFGNVDMGYSFGNQFPKRHGAKEIGSKDPKKPLEYHWKPKTVFMTDQCQLW